MSTCAKQVPPNRCYCRVRDELNLDEVAKLITTLNDKVLGLRSEISDLKNVTDGDAKLPMTSNSVCTHASSCHYEREPDASPFNVNFDRSIFSQKSKFFPHFFDNKPINKIEHKYNGESLKNTKEINYIFPNDKLQTYYKTDFENELKAKSKKISKGTQCDSFSAMKHKKKRKFLKCFKMEAHIKEHNIFKLNKKLKISPKTDIHVTFDPYEEKGKLMNLERNHNLHNKALKSAIYELHRNNFSKSNLAELSRDERDRNQVLKFSKNRMSGGAEIRGNRLISDIYDKMHKINFYKNVKFDARNIKKRLDACINELNGIIDDVSLIFPNLDASEEF